MYRRVARRPLHRWLCAALLTVGFTTSSQHSAAARNLIPLVHSRQSTGVAQAPRTSGAQVFLPLEASEFSSFYTGQVFPLLQQEGYHSQLSAGLTKANRHRGACLSLARASTAGIIIFDVPIAFGRLLPLCAYLDNAAGRRQESAELKSAQKSLGRGDVGSACAHGFCIVGLTTAEIDRQGALFGHTLVILAMPNAANFLAAFDRAGALNVVSSIGRSTGAIRSLFAVMAGATTNSALPSLTDNARRALPQALEECGGNCPGMSASSETMVTLAPSVLDRTPGPATAVTSDHSFSVVVRFDTVMDRSSAANTVVTLSGCDNKSATNSAGVTWKNDHTISGQYKIQSAGNLTITVHAGQAKSAGARTELDGNDGGTADYDGAFAPNGDDFVWHVPCQLPVLHIVFKGSGTAERTVTHNKDGFGTHTSSTDQVSWTAVFDVDLRGVASLAAGVDPVSSTFYPKESSLTGMDTTASVIDTCPTGDCGFGSGGPCVPSFSNSFTRDPEVDPPVYLKVPPDADGSIHIFTAPYAILQQIGSCSLAPALSDTCNPAIPGGPQGGTGPLTADIKLNPKTWKPGTMSVQPDTPETWSCTSSDGTQTDTGSVTWSGTVTLSVPSS